MFATEKTLNTVCSQAPLGLQSSSTQWEFLSVPLSSQQSWDHGQQHLPLAEALPPCRTLSFPWCCMGHPSPSKAAPEPCSCCPDTAPCSCLHRCSENHKVWRRTGLMETRWRNQQQAQRTSNESQITVGNLALENHHKHIITGLLQLLISPVFWNCGAFSFYINLLFVPCIH